MTSSPRSPPLPPTSGAGTSASRSLPADTASLTTRGDADSDQSSISSGDPVFAFDPHQEYDFEDDDALALDRWYSRGSRKGMYEAPDRYEKMKEERRAAAAAAKLARPPKSLAPASLATTPRATSFDGEPPLLGPVVPISAYHPQEMSVELTLSEIDDDEEVGITREIDLDSDPEVHGNGRDKDRNPLSLAEALMVTEPPNPPPPSRTLPLLRNSSRYFTPIEKEKEAPPPLSGIDAEVERAKGWVLYSFSNGNLLEEQMTVSGYRIRPGELIEASDEPKMLFKSVFQLIQ